MNRTWKWLPLACLAVLLAGCGDGAAIQSDSNPDLTEVTPPLDVDLEAPGDGLVFPDVKRLDGDGGDGPAGPDWEVLDVELDFGPAPGEFGYPCDKNTDCLYGFCVETWKGKVCSMTCVEECPEDGWDCSLVVNSCPDCQTICVPKFIHLCQPCKTNNDCGGDLVETGDRCVDYGPFGKFCGGECNADADCPDGYVCEDYDVGEGETIGQCMPENGICLCTDLSIKKGSTTVCYVQNEYGTCFGEKSCLPSGLSECSALTPAVEDCNGKDDDCNGMPDDKIPQMDCEVPNAYGTCRGSFICQDGNMICDAPQAKPETCNGLDDNCDGDTDEGFKDSNGDGVADCQSEDDDNDGWKDWEDNCPVVYNPGQQDNDLDNLGDICDPDDDNDLVKDEEDCEPFDPKVYVGAVEQCDGKDNNCDGSIDEGYPDFDIDGMADCVDPDDDNDGVNDTFDNCPFLFNPDQLNTDGFPTDGGDACDPDDDNDGLLDKNDNCPLNYNPLQTDTNEDGIGDACQGDKDGDLIKDEADNCPLAFNPDQTDTDTDKKGDACDDDDDNDGEVDLTDCAPLDPAINHFANEECDGKDNNCNSQVDETSSEGCKDYFMDQDGDDWGAEASKCQCGPGGLYTAEDFGDCNDLDPTVNPGQKEDCNTAKDENCNGSDNEEDALACLKFYLDQDGDGFGTGQSKCLCSSVGKFTAALPGDCDDQNPLLNPGKNEICGNGIDDDCDLDQNDPNAEGCVQYYADEDKDGYGVTADMLCLCVPFGKYTAVQSGDCDDKQWTSNPGQAEVCGDGFDNNCNGTQNDENAIGCSYFYTDMDADGYGNPSDSKCLCAGFGKYTTKLLADCNDLVGSINPGAAEICNGIDDNCNAMVDEGTDQQLCSFAQAKPHIESVICSGGKCLATGCQEGWHDANQDASDGCECADDENEENTTSCANGWDLGGMSDLAGGAAHVVVGNDPDGKGDWYRFYAQDMPETNTDSFHVRVKFNKNPSNSYMLDMFWGGCGNNQQICAETTDAEWYTDFTNAAATQVWPAVPGPTAMGGGEGDCRPDSNHELTPTNFDDDTSDTSKRCTNNSQNFFVRVYLNPNKKPTCEMYEVEISNGKY